MSSIKYIIPVGISLFVLFLMPTGYQSKPHARQYNLRQDKTAAKRLLDSLRQAEVQIRLDTPPPTYQPSRFPTYRLKDRFTDPFSNMQQRPSLLDRNKLTNPRFEFLPDSNSYNYMIREQLGNFDYRSPTILSQDELERIEQKDLFKDYWVQQSKGENAETSTQSGLIPKIPIENQLFNRIFGGDAVEFRPTGFVNLDFAMQFQRVANPTLPIRQQRNTNFLFDPHANVNLIGKVGEKLQISGNFDTKASFQFENQFKVEYTGFEEDIIQKIEFGNVSFPLSTSLIQGSQNLQGVTTKLRFGRLTVNSVFSNQRARSESINLQGGAQRRNFEIAASDYEDNRHFFLAHFFRDNYERSVANLPVITSNVQITRLEVYTTNRVNNTNNLRNIGAFIDLGESDKALSPGNPNINAPGAPQPADNETNQLAANIDGVRNADNASTDLENTFGLTRGADFEVLRAARKLTDREYVFNPQLGYISLLTPLRNDEILAVAFEYIYNGQTYKVGELSEDYINLGDEEIVHLKMLRPSSIRLDLPTWDLMMKNVYSLNASQVNQENFQLRVIYRDDITGIDNPNLQEGVNTQNVPLLQLLGLDQLNPRNDPQPDGNFDYVEGITIDSRNGRMYFPVLEPFGSHLERQFNPVSETSLINKYVFDQLYESTKADALQAADKNKFFIVGSLEAVSSSDVSLPGINIAEGSVRVTAGGIPLVENEQYTVDYATGRVTILDEAVLNSGQEVKIDYEQADLFNLQTRRFVGTRFDYAINKDFVIGSTVMNLAERPVITRVNVGEEPINNTMVGADVSYRSDSRLLTRLVDKIPFIQTKETSSIDFYAEYAQLFPGGSRLSGEVSLIDDFEGTRTAFNLVRAPQASWRLGATPQLFAEAGSRDLDYAYRRAKLAWYNVDNLFYRTGTNLRPDNITEEDLQNHYVRVVQPQEIFRNRDPLQIQTNEIIFDVAYYPHERGPYNYNPSLNADGTLPNPRQNFGAITRAITSDIDFDNANVEYLEFWMMDPFIEGPRGVVQDGLFNTNNTTGGDLYINLGNVSEDVIPDGRHAFENGLPADGIPTVNNVVENVWGRITNQQYLTNAFDNNANARNNQDVGLDGLKSSDELSYNDFQSFITAVNAVVSDADARERIISDPSADDFVYYLGGDFDNNDTKILERYKNFNGLENNSPVSNAGGAFTPSSYNTPDNEDLNIDNTITDLEGYYQYKISVRPQDFLVGNNYIIDKVTNTINGDEVSWYLFRIPIREFDEKVGSIEGFKSIRFLRMFMTDFQQPVVLRFAQYQLVANQWRRYLDDLSDRTFGLPPEPYDANFNVSTVNIEENGAEVAGVTPYKLPPGVIRDRDITNINNRQLNEQSIQLCVEDLRNKDARAIFRNYNLDFLSYKRLRMYLHAESSDAEDGEVTAFVRLGTDFTENYYEIEVPLIMTAPGTFDPALIWPQANEIDVAFQDLTQTKVARNASGQNRVIPFSRLVNQYRITVVGNPDLSAVQTVMIGVRNPDQELRGEDDDGLAKSVCIWANELRITDFDQTAGWAALARTNVTLADFARVTAAASYTTFGFGALNQRISERARETTTTFDISATIALDKFFPKSLGIKLPLFVSYERRNVSPRFNPLDPDVELNDYLEGLETDEERNEYRRLVEENMTRRSINFTNVRKIRTNPDAKVNFYDIENLSFTWAYSEERRSDVMTADFLLTNQRWSMGYNYNKEANFIEPFKNVKLFNSPYLKLLQEFNFSLAPSRISIRGDLDRRFTRTLYRGADLTTNGITPLYEKFFTFNRQYDVQWNLTKNLAINYNATANAIIDEPPGEIDTRAKRDSIMENLRRFGRMKNFVQNVGANYKLPLDKIPLTDWISADAGYNVGYLWTAGAVGIADTLGNTMSNNRERSINSRVDLTKIYKKIKILKDVDKPPKPKPKNKNDTIPKKFWETNLYRALMRPVLSLKKINVNFSVQEQTVLPGFTKSPRFLGMDSTWSAPGWDFLLGSQDPIIRERAAENGWLGTSVFQNNPFLQSRRENLTIRADLEPLPDFTIQLDAKRTRQTNYQEIFRFNPDISDFESQNPLRTGNYSVSFIAFRTAFTPDDEQNESPVFQQFADNRAIVQARLNALNNNTGEYGLNSQDVLIPSFLAAYSGQDAGNINLSPFPKTPLPNWRIDYNGLSKIELFKKVFSSVSLSHSYAANYTVNNYTSSLAYGANFVAVDQDETEYLIPDQTNDDGDFIPVYVINQIVLSERFSPLIGVNVRTKSNITLRLDYNRERDLSLNLSNAQLAETRNQGFTFSLGYTKTKFKLPFKVNGKTVILDNELDMRLDMTLRDTRTIQRQLDDVSTITAGNLNFQIRPVISYVVNRQLTVQAYYERNVNTPQVSSSFPRRNTTAGFQLRYNIVP